MAITETLAKRLVIASKIAASDVGSWAWMVAR